jgi:hypothetical protein
MRSSVEALYTFLTLQAIVKLFATLVFTGVSEHIVQMGFYHLECE